MPAVIEINALSRNFSGRSVLHQLQVRQQQSNLSKAWLFYPSSRQQLFYYLEHYYLQQLLPQLQQLALAADQLQLSKEIVISTLSNLLDRMSDDA